MVAKIQHSSCAVLVASHSCGHDEVRNRRGPFQLVSLQSPRSLQRSWEFLTQIVMFTTPKMFPVVGKR